MRAGFHGIGLPVPIQPPPIQWLLRDDFTDTRAAGAVNGTSATPGPGARDAVDPSNNFSTNGGYLVRAGGVLDNPVLRYAVPAARSPGISLITRSPTSGLIVAGIANTLTTGAMQGAYLSGGTLRASDSDFDVAVASVSYPTTTITVYRLAGYHLFYIAGSLIYYAYSSAINAPALNVRIYSTLVGNIMDTARMVSTGWLPTPLASDGFGSTFGTTDGLGHAEGVAGGIGSGGGGLAWTQQVGTWGTSGEKAVATSLTGGVAIATVPLSSANVFAGVAITRTANSVGPVVRYVDADNYVYAVHDGTNSKLVKRVAGTETVLVNVAATYSANASPIIDCNGTAFRLYYNNTLSGTSTISDSVLQSGTLAGILTKDTGNTLDNFIVYAKGAEGQYSTLNQYTV